MSCCRQKATGSAFCDHASSGRVHAHFLNPLTLTPKCPSDSTSTGTTKMRAQDVPTEGPHKAITRVETPAGLGSDNQSSVACNPAALCRTSDAHGFWSPSSAHPGRKTPRAGKLKSPRIHRPRPQTSPQRQSRSEAGTTVRRVLRHR